MRINIGKRNIDIERYGHNVIYYLDRIVGEALGSFKTIATIFFGVFAIAAFFAWGLVVASALWGFISIAFLYLLKRTLGWLKSNISHTGGDYNLSGRHLIIRQEPDNCRIDLDGVDPERFEFADRLTAIVTAEINVYAYRNSPWMGTIPEKYKRNLSHINKNPYSILLIKSEDHLRFIGLTHIVPVNKIRWDLYVNPRPINGWKGGDNTFTDKYVCGLDPGDEPYGLIIFSVARGKEDTSIPPNQYADYIGDLFEKAMAFQISMYFKTIFRDRKFVPMLFHNENKSVNSFIEPAVIEKTTSHDETALSVFVADNQFYTLL